MKPYEIVAQPFTLYVAPIGEGATKTFPDVDATEAEILAAGWTKVGTSGDRNYAEVGVSVAHKKSHAEWHSLGSTGPRKVFPTEESLHIKMSLADLTLEQYALALNYNTVTTVLPSPQRKKIGLQRGLSMLQRALLVKGAGSPYGDNYAMQYEVPVAVQVSEPDPIYVKGAPALLALEWVAIEDPYASTPSERFGRLVAQSGT